MKKNLTINNFLYLILLFISFLFLCNWFDEFNRNKLYNSNYGYNNSNSIVISSKVDLSDEKVENIMALSNEYNVILEKKVISEENNKTTIHYLSFNNLSKVCKLFNINCNDNDTKYISTYSCNNCKVKNDFLNNDYHIFKLFNSYILEQSNYTGEYKVIFNDKKNYDLFIDELAKLLNVEKDSLIANGKTISKSNFEMIFKVYLISFIIVLFSIFISSLFETLKNSNKIGIYKLLGFSSCKIIKYNLMQEMKVALLITSVMFIIFNLFIPNNNIGFCILSLMVMLLIVILKMLVIISSTYFMNKNLKLINLIKHENITDKIIKFNKFFKILTFGIILTIALFLGIQMKLFIERKNEISSFLKYSDYAVFSQFYQGTDHDSLVGGSDELDESELELFKYLYNKNAIYVDFKNYFPKTKDDENYFKTLTPQGNKKYKYGTIDTNYLYDLNLINSSSKNKIVIDNKTSNNVFLIPKSLSDELENFKKFYYEYYDYNKNDEFIIYEDTEIPSLSPEIAANNHYLIKSPILKIITPNNVSIRQVSVFGIGYDTPLKIKIDKNMSKEDFFESIYDKLVELKLDDNLRYETFFTYDELFNNELNEIVRQLITFSTIMLLIFIIYIYIVIQSIVLYLKDKYKEVAIKKMSGFSNFKIFKSYILGDFLINSLTMIIIFTIFNSSYKLNDFLIIFVIINILEFIFNLLIIKMKLKNFIVTAIKGGEI